MERYRTRLLRWFAFLICSATIGLGGCSKSGQQQAQADQPPTPVEVVTLTLTETKLTSTHPGRVTAFRTAEIRPQVSGIIIKRLFKEGAYVEAGTQLYLIDPASYEAELATAKGELAVAQANAHSARLKAQRYRTLVSTKAVSQQEADEVEAAWKSAQAEVKAAEARVKSAQINVDYTLISAPISGTISRSAFTEGALVSVQQETALATIHQLSPVYVDIQQPVVELLKMKRLPALKVPSVTLQLEDGTSYGEAGKLQFSEVSVNMGTGTVNTRAVFENNGGLLLPGLFVRATIVSESLEQAIFAPQQGIARQPNGATTALVVNDAGIVETRSVEVVRAIKDKWLVKSGLAEGDRLVVSGLQKIKPGVKVNAIERDKTLAATGDRS